MIMAKKIEKEDEDPEGGVFICGCGSVVDVDEVFADLAPCLYFPCRWGPDRLLR